MSERWFSILYGGFTKLDRRFFYVDSDTNAHEDATEAECAAEARSYIEEHGLATFLRDWSLDQDVTIHVGSEQVHP